MKPVDSLGPNADKLDVIRHIQALPPDHTAFRVFPATGYIKGDVVQCESCNQIKEATVAR
jgi:hypothetical protein